MTRHILLPLRRVRRPALTRTGPASADQQPALSVFGWLSARPVVDLALSAVVRFPRALMGAAALVGLVLTALTIASVASRPLDAHGTGSVAATRQAASPGDTPAEQQAILALIARYNQASIAAGLLGRADLLSPFLAPEGSAWRDVQVEYARRQARGETSDAALVRWGVLAIQVTDASARITTQEQWDVVTSVGETVIASRRGVLVRNTYQVRRSPEAGWLIVAVDTTTLVG
jgi:hypothetical protein